MISVRALIFDMDGTLYRSARLDRWYEDSIYRHVAARRGLSPAAARECFDRRYAEVARELGHRPSKLYTLSRMGLSDKTWAASHGCMPVAEVLRPNPRLRRMLAALAARHRLGVVTNNHAANTEATLRALGIRDCFDEILTLSESRRFKPSSELYAEMARRLGVAPADCISIGDRYDLDLAPAAAIGMQTLWIQRLTDLYGLPRVVAPLLARTRPARAGLPAGAEALRRGELIVAPTDTVYGLACAPTPAAVRWLYRAKGRAETNPLVLLISDPAAASRFARVTARARGLMARHWPGPLTLVLPVKPGTPWGRVTRGGRTVALRVPDHDGLRRLLRAAGGAAATSSANPSGAPAPTRLRDVDGRILAFATLALDGGAARVGRPSTVARVTGRRLEILRQGSVEVA